MSKWVALDVKNAFQQHDKDQDGYLRGGELENAHEELWYTTHHPQHIFFLKDEL